MLDEDDCVESDIPAVNGPMLHSATQCREYVHAALRSYKREMGDHVRSVLLVPVLEKQRHEALTLLRKTLSTMRSGNCCDGEDASTSDEGRALLKELSEFLEPFTEPDRGE